MKNELRKKYLALRSSKDKAELKEASEKIVRKLFSVEELQQAKTIMVYVSFGSEVETTELIEELLKSGKIVCVPLCNSRELSMTARKITGLSDLSCGAYGIKEPGKTAPVISKENIDFVVVPGCVFSKEGQRIGYGKGYYDRFLRGMKAVSCGLAYDFCIVDELPYEETDIPLDMVITQSEIIKPLRA